MPTPVDIAALEKLSRLIPVALRSIPLDTPLPVDLFLIIDSRPVKFRTTGDKIGAERVKKLKQSNVQSVFVTAQDRKKLREFFWHSFTSSWEGVSERISSFKQAMHLESANLNRASETEQGLNDVYGLFDQAHGLPIFETTPMSAFLDAEAQGDFDNSHGVNVAVYSLALARKAIRDPALTSKIGPAALIHDIGETCIDLKVRENTDLVSKKDYKEAQKHTIYGLQRLKQFPGTPPEVAGVVSQHHENFDGTGYPNGLRGDQIQLLARVVSICDLFDTLTSLHAPQPLSPQDGVKMMRSMQPGRFDPEIFNLFADSI